MNIGDIAPLLESLGRSSTPDVPASSFGITLSDLVKGGTGPTADNNLILLTTRNFKEFVKGNLSFVSGIPGMLTEQAEDKYVSHLIIEAKIFDEGPWVGADSGAFSNLREEIFEAGRKVRARGGLVILIPSLHRTPGIDYPRIESTANTILGSIPVSEFEENARNSKIWNLCQAYITHNEKRKLR